MGEERLTGLGVDIVEVARMERILERTPSFKERVFSPDERAYCESKPKPAIYYAMRFAAKEAVLKALGTGFSDGVACTDIEVCHDDKGRPYPKLEGKAAQIAQDQGILEIHISLSRTHETAVANAIAVTQASLVPPKEDKMSAKEEIALAFKELRAVLDDLDDEMSGNRDEGSDEEADENAEGDPADDGIEGERPHGSD